MAVKLRKSVRSASYLTTQPRPFSPLPRSDFGIFQLSPRYPLIFVNWTPISSTYWVERQLGRQLPTVWAILLASFSQSPTQYLLPGWEFLSIFQLSPTQCLYHEWVCPICFTCHPLPPAKYLSYWEGADNLLHHQIKLKISTNTGDSRTRKGLPEFICTPQGGGWAQGATAGTKAPVPHGVQLKEGSPLWVPLWSP